MPSNPNIVVIVMDTARYDVIDSETTPNICNIAENGIKFENAFSCAPWTVPSHASLFTGTYPSTHGSGASYRKLDTELITMADLFSSNGYETIGYSNNAWISRYFGFDKGFNTFNHGWQYVQSENDLAEAVIKYDGWKKTREVVKKLVLGNPIDNLYNLYYGLKYKYVDSDDKGAQKTTESITNWLAERSNPNPFFLFINYLEPHLEYRPPAGIAEEFLPKNVSYEEAMKIPQNAWEFITGQVDITEKEFEILRALYRAEVRYIDDKIGTLVESIKRNETWEDTVLLILGDHGENIGHHDLMDHQYCLYDSLLHVPLVVNGGQLVDCDPSNLVQINDILPTLIHETSFGVDGISEQIEGTSFHPGSDEKRDYLFAEYLEPQPSKSAIEKRVGDPHNAVDKYDQSLRAIRNKQLKLIRGSDGKEEVYDIVNDPEERVDIYESGDYSELKEVLDTWTNSRSDTTKDADGSIDSSIQARLESLGYLQE